MVVKGNLPKAWVATVMAQLEEVSSIVQVLDSGFLLRPTIMSLEITNWYWEG